MGGFFRYSSVLLLLPLSVLSWRTAATSRFAQDQSQSPIAAPQAQPAVADVKSNNREITLDVQVTDKSGAPVRDLQRQDFTLLDNKQPGKIQHFSAVNDAVPAGTDPPLEIILVVDAVNAGFDTVTYERDQIKKFLLQNGGKLPHPVGLIVLSGDGTKVMKGASRDGAALAALLDQYETGLRTVTRAQGFYGAQENFDLSLKALNAFVASEGKLPGRKLMIWISPGWPLLSGRNVDLSAKNEQSIFAAIVANSAAVSQGRITVYSVDPLGTADAASNKFYEEFVKGITSPSQVRPGNLSLQVIAVQSGGHVFNSNNDLFAGLSNCAADADAYYVLSYISEPAEKPNEYHSIEVKVDKPGVIARTRTGYYAQP